MSRPSFLRPLRLFAVIPFVTAFTALFALTACAPRETNVERGNRDQILHRGIGIELPTLDPHLSTLTNEYHVLSALFEGLVSEDPVDLHPVPGVATHWEISPDGLTYTFHLRADARWSNGDPVTAHDFVASIRRALTPELAAPNASLLHILQGAQAFHQGRQADFTQVGATAINDYTLRLTLEHPAAYFLSLLNHPVWFPVHLDSITALGSPADRSTAWAMPGKLVGNGPFTLQEWLPNRRLVVAKNPAYWDAATVALNGVHFHPIDSLDAEERAFRTGQLHVTEAMPVARIAAYQRDHPELLRIDPYLGTYFFRINVNRPFLNESKVRRALALAVDRQSLIDAVLKGGQLPAHAFTPPGTAGYEPPAGFTYDLPAAKALLAEAGYPEGKGAPDIELLYNTSENHKAVAEAVQSQLAALGLTVRLINQESGSVLAARRTGDYELLRSSWIADYVDPASFLEIWTSSSGNNHTGWTHSDYDRLLYRAARTTDAAERNALYRQAEEILLNESPILPLYYYTHVFLIHPSVQGWHPTLLDHHPWKHVRLSSERG